MPTRKEEEYQLSDPCQKLGQIVAFLSVEQLVLMLTLTVQTNLLTCLMQ